MPQPENALDKQIAAAALTCGLTLVTRSLRDFAATGAPLLDPFEWGGLLPWTRKRKWRPQRA